MVCTWMCKGVGIRCMGVCTCLGGGYACVCMSAPACVCVVCEICMWYGNIKYKN